MKQFHELSLDSLKENPFQMIGSQWMLITAGNQDKLNTMTASWGGLGVMFNKQVAYIVLRPQRYTKEFVDREETFSLSFLPNSYKKVQGYLGSVSGRDEDKISKSGLSVAFYEGTPYFEESQYVMICRKKLVQPLEGSAILDDKLRSDFYPGEDYHVLYICEITTLLQED